MRVLLVEDDPMLGASLHEALRYGQWSVDWVRSAAHGELALRDGGYLLALLDLGLPDASGLELLRSLRARRDPTPVLIITARDALDDRVAGLDAGADDYVVKPFHAAELLARMRAVVRRRAGAERATLGTDAMQLDLAERCLVCGGRRHALTAREFSLVQALLERPGAILSREQLESRLYGWGEEVSSNAVDVIIHGLRRKLGPEAIRNVRGLGWRVAGERDAA